MIALNKLRIGVLSPPPVLDDGFTLDCKVAQFVRAERTPATSCFRRFGGEGVHVCAALAGSDPLTTLVALFPVSQCRSGSTLLRDLKARGICVDHVMRYAGRMPRNVVIEFPGVGSRVIVDPHSPSASEEHYDFRPIGALGSLLLSGAVDPAVLHKAIELARNHRVPWSWNPSSEHFELLGDLAPGASLLQVDHRSAAKITGLTVATPPPMTATALQQMTSAGAVVLTCGQAGSVGRDARGRLSAGPPPKLCVQSVEGADARLFALVHCALQTMGRNLGQALCWASGHLA